MQLNTEKKLVDKSELPQKANPKNEVKLASKSENKSSNNLDSSNDIKTSIKQEKENVAPSLLNYVGDVSNNKQSKEKQKTNEVAVASTLVENKNDKRDK